MLLDLEDVQIRVRIVRIADDKIRLTLEYPRAETYRNRVMNALADLLRPAPTTAITPKKPAELSRS
jgi:hypothetical protein